MDCSRWQFSMFILGDQYYLRVELTCISRSLLCIMEDQLELSMNCKIALDQSTSVDTNQS
jgi:hypothetical protein